MSNASPFIGQHKDCLENEHLSMRLSNLASLSKIMRHLLILNELQIDEMVHCQLGLTCARTDACGLEVAAPAV